MKIKTTKLFINSSCEGCTKNCEFKGLTTAERSGKGPYGCNTSK